VATVTVSFTPLPAHVRTARFVAASVARRAGVADATLDEIRLAVSEACSLAVRFHLAQAPQSPVELRLTELAETFSVQVVDAVQRAAPDVGGGFAFDLGDDEPSGPGSNGSAPGVGVQDWPGFVGADGIDAIELRDHERIGLAVISGLVDDLAVEYLDSGSVVTMTWPIG
jgi:serine/threonine-protein kinase RsbW